ncbi:MAG: CHASE3 domain-containing protein [Gammaproteobacteria bacterium]|uniref:CHASE3 domain-containing protein n=1 Tax=unclassified Pseudacidovorax TaxID=2620592 RepID=UPI001B77E90C|nr:CHASE3 domain-containing protein [Pseudacidovorax sp.]MBP6895461.1 CHASE3 domain-containing protein [Pseudacidovorax sp.]
MRLPGDPDLRSLLRSAPFVALLVVAGILSFRYHQLLLSQRASIEHTYQVLTTLESTLVYAIDAETGQRGFIITGEDRYLEPYDRALAQIGPLANRLRALVSDSAVQQRRVDRLEYAVALKLAELHETVQARRNQGLEAARALVLRDEGKRTMDEVRAVVAEMRVAESELLDQRNAQAHATERWLLAITLACTALSVLARLGLAMIARFHVSRAALPAAPATGAS